MSTFRCGAAKRDVTPDPLLPVTAGAGSVREATELRMPLEVRALVWESGDTRVAVASVPLIGFPTWLCERVRAAVTTVPRENILIGATHTHGAPEPYGFPNEDGEYTIDFGYLDRVCRATAEAVDEAAVALAPARLRVATGAAQGKIAYNYYAPELYDPRCSLLQALCDDGTAIATLINYAIHPEVLLRAPVCTPDLVGPLLEALDAHAGGISLFMNGAQGGMVTADIRTPEGDLEAWEECERVGRLLAQEGLRILSGGTTHEAPALACTRHEITFPIAGPIAQMMQFIHPHARAQQEFGESISVQQHHVTLGPAHILTLPGEALPNIGFYLKRKMRGEHNLLFGLTNDALGYMLTRVDYDSFATYEYISATSLGEETGEILIAKSLELVERAGR